MGQIELGKIFLREKEKECFCSKREGWGWGRERERERERMSKYCKASANMYCSYSS